MKIYLKILIVLCALHLPAQLVYSQDDDDNGEIKMSQEEWQLKRDQYAVSAIILLERMEKLDSLIDSLKKVNDGSKKTINNYEEELLSLVGATKEQVADYRKKFDETESRINNKSGSPSEIQKTFYSELAGSKIRCLPEFRDRYASLKSKISSFTEEPKKENDISDGTYLVLRGDYLWKISEEKYGTANLWPAIWDANKNGVVNKDSFEENYMKRIFNPNFIFPGQILRIPSNTEAQKKKFNNYKTPKRR